MTIVYRMYVKFRQKLQCLGWCKTSQALRRKVNKVNKVELLKGQFRNEKLQFVDKKEAEYSFELYLFICVFCLCILSLEMQNFGLENHRMVSAGQSFC